MLTYKLRSETTAVVLHDSHTPPSQSDVQHFLAVGGREKGLLDIGYHFLILRDGQLIECRPHGVQGTHLRSKHNRDTIGVCLAGGLSEEFHTVDECGICYDEKRLPENNFTVAQWDTLMALMSYLRGKYGSMLELVGHSEIDKHHKGPCPCVNMEEVRKACSR
jgi:N-acetyl-anhydromuramyl-L-alanine amidase AmpD